jgi:hypothetical protein
VAAGCNRSTLAGDTGDGVASNVDFGTVLLNQQSAPQSVSITNTGEATLVIGTTTLGGANAADFMLTSPFPASIPAGTQGSATAVFTPTAVGARIAILTVATNGTPETLSIDLTGAGEEIQVCANPAALTFDPLQVQGTPVSQNVTLTNCGQSPANISAGPISGIQATDYSVAAMAPALLQPGQAITVTVAFSPWATGSSNGNLGYYACDTSLSPHCVSETLALSGTGIDGALTFSPNPIPFVGVDGGQSASLMVTATNSGTETITLTGLTTQSGNQTIFEIEGAPSLPMTLLTSMAAAFTVTYSPSGSGGNFDQIIGTFTVADPAVAPRQVLDALIGDESSGACLLTGSPTSLSFGNVPPGVATTRSVALTNASPNASCAISGVALDASTDPAFSLPTSQPLSFSISANSTAQIQVTIDPANANPPLSKLGTLLFDSNGTPASGSVALSAYVDAG